MNNFELHERAEQLSDQYSAYQLARMYLKAIEKQDNENLDDEK